MRRPIALAIVLLAAAAPAQADTLRAGAGRSDVTPPTGYPLLGWARGDARATGQHTRLYARAVVLERGGRKLALVAVDANSIPGGMVKHAIDRVRPRGFDETNVIVAASHTHGGPTGFSNFLFKDSASPTAQQPQSGMSDPDPLLYTFMVERTALAIQRADDDLGRAAAGWGSGQRAARGRDAQPLARGAPSGRGPPRTPSGRSGRRPRGRRGGRHSSST